MDKRAPKKSSAYAQHSAREPLDVLRELYAYAASLLPQ